MKEFLMDTCQEVRGIAVVAIAIVLIIFSAASCTAIQTKLNNQLVETCIQKANYVGECAMFDEDTIVALDRGR